MVEKTDSAYHYQKIVKKLALEGNDVLLQAPTGSGKTRASLEAGIVGIYEAEKRMMPDLYPQRIIYAVPMRVLGRSFHREYDNTATIKNWKHHWRPTIQTGETPDDPLFEGRLVFATVDQMLASFLNVPYGIPKKLDNINAGAFIGAYLIFDEFHLYPRDQMMLTVLAMLKMLKGISRFSLMSATFSPVLLQTIGDYLGAEVVSDPPGTRIQDGLFHDVKSIQTQKRTFYAADGPLAPSTVLDIIKRHDARRILCICNTVDRAQALFDELHQHDEINTHLLHSRMYQQDRRHVEDHLIATFQNVHTEGKPEVLIATQVVEVGLDISSAVMLTECAPAASLIQRAGRCARRANEEGHVYIFQPLQDGEVNYAPYVDDGYEDVCRKTWDELRANFHGEVMTFAEEQRWIDAAHGEHDAQLVDGLHHKVNRRINQITACMRDRDTGHIPDLIRTNNSVPLLIHPEPKADDDLCGNPHRYEGINVTQHRIKRAMEALADNADSEHLPFWFMGGVEKDDTNAESLTPNRVWAWQPLKEAGDAYKYHRFVVHPQAVTYSDKLGLRLQPSEQAAPSSPKIVKPPYERIDYHAERYYEHILGLMMAYKTSIRLSRRQKDRDFTGIDQEIAYPLKRLCEATGRDFAKVERLLRLTIALHDLGKLGKSWQTWAKNWQQYRQQAGFPVEFPADEPMPLAHTDALLSQEEERELQKAFNRQHPPRGNHAVESAMIAYEAIRQVADGDKVLQGAVTAAIMHHHTPIANTCGAFQMMPEVNEAVNIAMRYCGFEIEGQNWMGVFQAVFQQESSNLRKSASLVVPTQSYVHAFFYFVFVRTLRLADQRSGNYWQKYKDNKEIHEWDRPYYMLKKIQI